MLVNLNMKMRQKGDSSYHNEENFKNEFEIVSWRAMDRGEEDKIQARRHRAERHLWRDA